MSKKEWDVSGKITDGSKIWWNYSFTVIFHDDTCHVTFRPKVELTFPSGWDDAKKDKYIKGWGKAIDKAFNNKWKLVPKNPGECESCPEGIKIYIRVKFDYGWSWTEDYEVDVHDGNKRSMMRNWYIGDSRFSSSDGCGVVHELGHMLGLKDEFLDSVTYPDKTAADLPPDADKGFMNDPEKRTVLDRHMHTIAFDRAKVNKYLPCPDYRLERI